MNIGPPTSLVCGRTCCVHEKIKYFFRNYFRTVSASYLVVNERHEHTPRDPTQSICARTLCGWTRTNNQPRLVRRQRVFSNTKSTSPIEYVSQHKESPTNSKYFLSRWDTYSFVFLSHLTARKSNSSPCAPMSVNARALIR